MSYTNATVSPAARLRAASGVIAVHPLLGAGVVLCLAFTGVIKPPQQIIETWDIKEVPPPPPPQPNVEPAEQAIAPVTAQHPPIPLERTAPIEVEQVQPNLSTDVVLLPPSRPIEIPGPAVTPSVTPSITPASAVPRNGPTGWITTNDYARSDLIREREGTAGSGW